MTVGGPAFASLGILQTRKSPSNVCEASISDLDLDEEPCHDKQLIGEGALCVFSVCRMLNVGTTFAINTVPFKYLVHQLGS
jgi:hypothetical protein